MMIEYRAIKAFDCREDYEDNAESEKCIKN